jgi:putative tryptophan/tyrosine transport system substrate-binding protein
MRRLIRLAVILTLGFVLAPLASEAQTAGKVPRVGITVTNEAYYDGFLQGLREAGWVQGQNIVIERRSIRGERERSAAIAAEIVALNVDVIVASGPWMIASFKKATSTIPIVGLDLESDPVATGFVASLARPGGNVTGVFLDLPELGGKQLQFLRETVPGLARVAVLWDAEIGTPQRRATEEAGRAAGLTLHVFGVRRSDEIGPALERAVRGRAQALVVLTSPMLFNNRAQIVELARKNRLPSISPFTMFPDAGALMAYGPNVGDMYRRAAAYVDKVLRGARVAELPVERPSKFELVVNKTTAKALGLTIPQSVLLRADRIIE